MKQLYCKNCGAPIEHRYTHRCRYCDTVIFSDDEEDEQEEDKEIDIDLELYNCDKFNPVSKEEFDAMKDSLDRTVEKTMNIFAVIFRALLLSILSWAVLIGADKLTEMLNK